MRNHGLCKKKRKRWRHTSDSGSSRNIGQVADTSFLCLNCKKEKALYKNSEEKVKLEITYSPLSSGGCRRGRCLPLATSGPARRRSISKWPQSSRLRLAYSRALTGTGTGRRRRRAL